ncbi:nitrogenase component 1 [Lacrimispora sp.]|uniref:nitrogenase component 1 n=1 Tax=Lacrimispora sp. TaxID=2719234 RepID=UPI0032E4765C
MPLYKNVPEPSGRMGLIWSLAPIYDSAVIEYGSMGHMLYAQKWMNQTGLIKYGELISTHLSEKDIALGITKRLEECVEEVVKHGRAKVIFLIPSSVPEMIGNDLESIGEELAAAYPDIPIISFKAGNFKASREQGMEEAYEKLVRYLSEKDDGGMDILKKDSFNLFGISCDWSRFQADAAEICRIMKKGFDMEPAAILGSSCSMDQICQMTKAKITLVIRKEGLKAAKLLYRQYGIPYIYLAPYGFAGTLQWVKELETLLGKTAEQTFIKKEKEEVAYAKHICQLYTRLHKEQANIWISGEDELARGISTFAMDEIGFIFAQGGIHMSDGVELRNNPGMLSIEVRRSILSQSINPYELPFMGFRGALNLCGLWHQYITDRAF